MSQYSKSKQIELIDGDNKNIYMTPRNGSSINHPKKKKREFH